MLINYLSVFNVNFPPKAILWASLASTPLPHVPVKDIPILQCTSLGAGRPRSTSGWHRSRSQFAFRAAWSPASIPITARCPGVISAVLDIGYYCSTINSRVGTLLDLVRFDELDTEKICRSLAVYGIAIVNNYLSTAEVQKTRDEIAAIDEDSRCLQKRDAHISNKDGETTILDPRKFGPGQQTLNNTFLSAAFRRVVEQYFCSRDIKLNDQIYVTHEYHDERPILPWHFDRTQSLKFYINLVDTDESNGAFGFCLKSHREGNLRANYHIFRGVPIHEIPNDVPEDELYNCVTVCAQAGDLVIFDAAGFHRAGIVSPGKERLVVRGHSHPCDVHTYGKARPFSPQWWIRSPLNVVKLLANKVERRNTISTSKAVLTRKISHS
jgi:hypothetical protein